VTASCAICRAVCRVRAGQIVVVANTVLVDEHANRADCHSNVVTCVGPVRGAECTETARPACNVRRLPVATTAML
jgi:hypothetical protein